MKNLHFCSRLLIPEISPFVILIENFQDDENLLMKGLKRKEKDKAKKKEKWEQRVGKVEKDIQEVNYSDFTNKKYHFLTESSFV